MLPMLEMVALRNPRSKIDLNMSRLNSVHDFFLKHVEKWYNSKQNSNNISTELHDHVEITLVNITVPLELSLIVSRYFF